MTSHHRRLNLSKHADELGGMSAPFKFDVRSVQHTAARKIRWRAEGICGLNLL